MGAQHTTWAMGIAGVTSSERCMLYVLGNSANDDNECWPGLSLLSRRTSLSRRHVQRVLHALARKKLIEIIPRTLPNSREHTSNLYRLNVAAVVAEVETSLMRHWEAAREKIRSQVGHREFEIWFRSLQVLSLKKNVLTLLAANIHIEAYVCEKKEILIAACKQSGFKLDDIAIDARGIVEVVIPSKSNSARQKGPLPNPTGAGKLSPIDRALARRQERKRGSGDK